MLTADLIDALATDVRAVAPARPLPRLAGALAIGAALALVAVVAVLGVQPGLVTGGRLLPFGMKAAYAAAVGGLALFAAGRLVRPDGEFGRWGLLIVPVAALAALAVWRFASLPGVSASEFLLGASWNRCPWRIAALSLPVMAVLFAGARRHAPTQLRRTGAALGLASGASAALVYALACTENSPAFVLVWYSAGVALATALGALVGPRLLRW